MSNVGFIGVGVMGMPMARNLIKGGHRVRAYDINADALATLARDGADAAASPADAVTDAEFVFTMLPRHEHVEAALFGPDGAAAALDDGALLVEMSTVLPSAFDRMAARLAEQAKQVIDAPVGRTSQHAVEGKLLIMVGGENDHVAKARPLLELLGDTIVHCGPTGSGMRTKLINNYVSIVSNVVVAEGLAAAEAADLERDVVIDVLLGTTAGQGHLATTYPAKVLAGDLEPGFMIDLAHKDLGLALQMGQDTAVPLPTGVAALTTYEQAQSEGRGRQDWTAILEAVRHHSGLGN